VFANDQEVADYAASTALDEILEEEIRNEDRRENGVVDVDYGTRTVKSS